MALHVAIADSDPVTRLAGLALQFDPEQETFLTDYFSSEGTDAAATIRSIASDAVDLQAVVQRRVTPETDIVIVRRGTFDEAFFATFPRVRFIQRVGRRPTGVDLAAAARAGVAVACLPRPSIARTAEHIVLLMLAAGKSLREAERRMRDGFVAEGARAQDEVCYNWTGLTLAGLYGETIGLIGLGEVGQEVLSRLRGFEARLLYWKQTRLPVDEEHALGIEWASLDDLLARSRYVSLQLASTPQTQRWMNAEKFAKMRPDAFFINASRGKLVDENALYAALKEKHIAGAGIDVHAVEPAHWDALRAIDSLIVSPHIAGGARSALVDEVAIIVQNVRAFMTGASPLHLC